MSDPNWSGNGKSQDRPSASPPHADEERILSLTVDIPQGTQEVLEIRASDDIEAITEDFCAKHDLDADCKQMLLDNIRVHLFGTNGTNGTERQIQEDQSEEDRVDTDAAGRQTESPAPDNVASINTNNAETITGEEGQNPRQMEELAGELESWKKEAEMRIREKITTMNHPVINDYSRKLVERRGLDRVPVYERLHKRVSRPPLTAAR